MGFEYIIILLASAVVTIFICRRLQLPAIIGYLLVGIIVGPGGLKWIPTIEELHFLAEFGVVFLMFTLGLEFSLPRLITMRRILLGVGGLQVLICTGAGMLISLAFGLEAKQAFIISGALALSSTAVVVKQLFEQQESQSPHGQLAINILLFQDMAALLFLILIPALSDKTHNIFTLGFFFTLAQGIGVFITMTMLGFWLLRPIFHQVARAHSNELFMMATLLVTLSAAWVSHFFNFSMAFGAFMAGLMLGETEFKQQLELDIKPFRDVLLGLFFIVVGAYLQLHILKHNFAEMLFILFLLIVGKALFVILAAYYFGQIQFEAALRTGIILAHGGEFSFVVLTEAIKHKLVEPTQRPAIFAAVVVSLLLAPLFIRFYSVVLKKFRTLAESNEDKEYNVFHLSSHVASLSNHVIICGFGRVGQILARFLEQENITWLALDLDPMRLSKSSIAGENSFYGDATNPEILAAAGLAKARMVVVSFSNETFALRVLRHVRSMRLDLPIFVRTKDDANLQIFQLEGATEVVPELLEGSLMLAFHLLLTLGIPTEKILSKLRRVHKDRYKILQGMYRGVDDLASIEDEQSLRRSLHSLFVAPRSYAVGKSISNVFACAATQAEVKYLTRNGTRIKEPDPDLEIQANDVIVVYATPEEAYILDEKILQGGD